MWQKIIDIAKTASSMLHSGEIPPNTPKIYRKDLSKINFLASKKFYVVFCSVIILAIFYAASIVVLFLTSAAPHLTTPFVSIFTETIKILAIIIASYLGVQTVLDYKMQSNTNIEVLSEDSFEQVITDNADDETVSKFESLYENEPSYAPLNWIQAQQPRT